ncbi:MAG: YdbH domain-containing protein [Nibricoccus sp.]
MTIFAFFGVLVAFCHAATPNGTPKLQGEIKGELKLFNRTPEFTLPWRLALASQPTDASGDTKRLQAFSWSIESQSTRLYVSGQIDLFTGDGWWRIENGWIDAAAWLALVAPRLSGIISGAAAGGDFLISGEGTLRQGQASGRLKLQWRGGMLTHATQGWTIDGIEVKGEFAIDIAAQSLVSVSPLEVSVRTIAHPRFGARAFSMKGNLTERRTLEIEEMRIEIAGGEIVVDPAEVPLQPFAIDLNLHINRVGLQDIVLLVPAAGLADARGRIDGEVRAKWSAATDFQVGVGHLELHNDEPTTLRLAPALGLMTGRVPQFIDLLPKWMGPLARWTRVENPAYKDLQNVELGKSELMVSSLHVNLTPNGDERGRSATVQFVARPTESGTSVKEVTFDVNVAGPLNQVLKVGMTQNFSISAQ